MANGKPGRPKGARNRRTAELLDAVAEAREKYGAPGPIEVLVKFLKSADAELRLRAAEKLMPYMHPKLRASEIKLDQERGNVILNIVPRKE